MAPSKPATKAAPKATPKLAPKPGPPSATPKPPTSSPNTLASLATALQDRLLALGADSAVYAAVTAYTASVADWALSQVNRLPAAPATATPSPSAPASYAAALQAPPKPLTTKEQRELLVRRPKDPQFNGSAVLAAVNARLRPLVSGSFVGVRALPSGDLIFIADSATTKTAAERTVSQWQSALGDQATVQPKRYTVLVHGVRTSLLPNNAQAANVEALYTANPRLRLQVQILRTWWRKRVERLGKKYSSILLDVATAEQANRLINDGLALDNQIHDVELFDSKCLLTRCFNCQGYNHTATNCRKPRACRLCGSAAHAEDSCRHTEKPDRHKCVNCRGKHPAGHTDCPAHTAELKHVAAARASKSRFFAVAPPDLHSTVTPAKRLASPPPLCSPPTISFSAPVSFTATSASPETQLADELQAADSQPTDTPMTTPNPFLPN
ncbi:FAD binding domain protein [Ascosphaera apis ARSEF 7405]|uniref:FAD binding domain protein n=1 Tax=Ascosphaera apis ARSEF 7405 TaxID=392613 RepID=A0A167WM72_9EURO|nr:FAD binding domain protein [Ascosphaera apis ARSEF 7405]